MILRVEELMAVLKTSKVIDTNAKTDDDSLTTVENDESGGRH